VFANTSEVIGAFSPHSLNGRYEYDFNEGKLSSGFPPWGITAALLVW